MAKESAFGQGIRRVTSLLQALGHGPRSGMRLIDIATATKLSKPTAYRLLTGLNEVGLVEHDEATGHFHLGFEMFVLGSSAIGRYGISEIARPHLVRLESRCHDTTYLSVRSGFDSVCIDRHEGSYPVKVLTLNVGDRRPLGIGGAALALLAFMPDAEIDKVIEANRARLASYPNVDVPKLYALIELSRRQGYAFFDGLVVPEMAAIGLPIIGRGGKVVAAMGVSAIRSRMLRERREELVKYMKEAAAAVQARLETLTSGLTESAIENLKQLSTRPALTHSSPPVRDMRTAVRVKARKKRRASS
jgi:DNA-binding IclR family transcriptional regulator